MKTKASTITGDIPMKFGTELAAPLTDIINRSIIFGEYPNSWTLLGDGTLGPIFCPFALLGFNRNVGHGANFC